MSDPHAFFGQQCGLQRGPTSSTILNTVNGNFCYLYIIHIFPILNTITLGCIQKQATMHVIIVTYRHWSRFWFVVRGKSVLCVVSCRLGLSVVTAPQESLIYIYLAHWGEHTRITDASILLWGVERSSSTPPVHTNVLCVYQWQPEITSFTVCRSFISRCLFIPVMVHSF